MKGSAILPILLSGLTPIVVLTLIITATALGPIAWKPPTLWIDSFGRGSNINSATVITADSSALYVQGITNGSLIGGPSGTLILRTYGLDGSLMMTRAIGNTSTALVDGISVVSD